MNSLLKLKLVKNREKPVLYGHPWIFSGALDKPPETTGSCIAEVLAANGKAIGTGFYTPHARLAVRMLSLAPDAAFNATLITRRIEAAINRRKSLLNAQNDSVRLVFAESDFLPGLIVDQLGDILSVQLNSAFAETYRETILQSLRTLRKPRLIVDTSDSEARNREGLTASSRIDEMPEHQIINGGIRYALSAGKAQKTGFYLDQSENRRIVGKYGRGRRMLDAFCYSGGFSLAGLANGAVSVHAVDSSEPALELFGKNLKLNTAKISSEAKVEIKRDDVFTELRRLKEVGQQFDLLVIDPPKLATSRSKLPAAEKAYKDLNLQALHLAAPGAILATFSCSGAMTFEKLRQVLHYAAHDAGKQLQIIRPLVQSDDHPVLLAFPESEYLRGYLCRVY